MTRAKPSPTCRCQDVSGGALPLHRTDNRDDPPSNPVAAPPSPLVFRIRALGGDQNSGTESQKKYKKPTQGTTTKIEKIKLGFDSEIGVLDPTVAAEAKRASGGA
ncbi:hypothetical protein COLO4_33767 [Corchorus olitorius]|uniref:Uncharacterized protein n=1 Tax=Corchorus olitorius TaxID=93759 RepID=A0A1R3GRH5_9ROSI|nr:hypothetical protein COLO4_33767 [Corchorus olitorius]